MATYLRYKSIGEVAVVSSAYYGHFGLLRTQPELHPELMCMHGFSSGCRQLPPLGGVFDFGTGPNIRDKVTRVRRTFFCERFETPGRKINRQLACKPRQT